MQGDIILWHGLVIIPGTASPFIMAVYDLIEPPLLSRMGLVPPPRTVSRGGRETRSNPGLTNPNAQGLGLLPYTTRPPKASGTIRTGCSYVSPNTCIGLMAPQLGRGRDTLHVPPLPPSQLACRRGSKEGKCPPIPKCAPPNI